MWIIALFVVLALTADERSFDLRHGAELEFDNDMTVQMTNEGDAPYINLEKRF